MTAENPTLTLAPAAGAGLGKLLADSLLSDPEFVPLMRKTAIECLHAMAPRRWDKESGGWVADPDMKTRAQMFFGLIAHMEGEPVKRIIHQHLGADGKLDLRGALQDSPELAAAVAAELEKAQWRKSGRNAKKAAPVIEGEEGPAKPADKF